MNRFYDIGDVELKGYLLSFKVNGVSISCDLTEMSVVPANATEEQVLMIVVDPVGVGFHWPELDEDLSVKGILREMEIEASKLVTEMVEPGPNA